MKRADVFQKGAELFSYNKYIAVNTSYSLSVKTTAPISCSSIKTRSGTADKLVTKTQRLFKKLMGNVIRR